MADRKPVLAKGLLLASLLAGLSFWVAKDMAMPLALKMAWKGAGVSLLALYALSHARSRDGYRIVLVMALGALGDVLLELNFQAGAAAFLLGHVAAMDLYLRHRRESTSGSQKALAVALLIGTPLIAWLLPADRTMALPVAVYALVLGGMAGTAWTSSFPRYRVGIGAVLFVASDVLIFARMGPLAGSVLPSLLIWPLYYFGQLLICLGVVGTLRTRSA